MDKRKQSESWSHKRFRVKFQDDTKEDQDLKDVMDELIDPNSVIDQLSKPSCNPPTRLSSKLSFKKLLKVFGELNIKKLLTHFKQWKDPLKNTEYIIKFPSIDIIDISGWGIGKTTGALLGGLTRVAGKKSSYILSFTYSGGLGVTHQNKYHKLSNYLTNEDERAVIYQSDLKNLTRRIRSQKEPFSMLIITPQAYFGTLAHHSPLLEYTRQSYLSSELETRKAQSPEYQWYETLLFPELILFDEIDAYPSYMIPVFAHMVQILKWKYPHENIQTILLSGTIGNPEVYASRIFGANKKYRLLKGTGRRGKLNINVYEESGKDKLFLKLIKLLDNHTEHENKQYNKDRNYKPRKVVLFVNHKPTINFESAKKTFSKHYCIIHGGLPFSDKMKILKKFEENPRKIVLVSTELIYVGVDLPEVVWGILYGLPKGSKRIQKYMQLLARFVRNSADTGRIDIILRKNDKYESSFISHENQEKRRAFILREELVSSPIPYYTPRSLEFWIVMSVLCGFYSITSKILKNLTLTKCPNNFQRDLSKAVHYLISKNAIRFGEKGKLLPTTFSQTWIYDFIRPTNDSTYNIFLKGEKTDDTTFLGRVDQLQLYQYSLENQSLPWNGKYYLIKRIDDESKKVFVEHTNPDLQLPRNWLSKPAYYRLKLLAYDQSQEIALMKVASERVVTEIDSRTHSKRSLYSYQIYRAYPAVFFQVLSNTTEDEVETKISNIKNRLKSELLLNPEEFTYEIFPDERFGTGILLIDTSEQKLAEFIYEHLILTSGSLKLPKSNQALVQASQTNQNYSFSRLPRFLKTYLTIIILIADMHLDGTPFSVYGKEVDFGTFWKQFIGAIRKAMKNTSGRVLLVFLGDTYDKSMVVDSEEADDQLDILNETIYENDLLKNTDYIQGNHDFHSDIYCWKLPVRTHTEMVLDISPTRRLFLLHGNNCGIDQWIGKNTLTEEDIITIRRNINYHKKFLKEERKKFKNKDSDEEIMIRPQDPVGIGHLHNTGVKNPNLNFLAVPPFRKILKKSQPGTFGCIGLIGYGTELEADVYEMAIDRLKIN